MMAWTNHTKGKQLDDHLLLFLLENERIALFFVLWNAVLFNS